MSYYLKYRPQTVEELDLTSVRKSLMDVQRSGKFAHAYLFTGPKGTGKTSSARILAKILNCEKNRKQVAKIKNGEDGKNSKLQEPCGVCGSCKGIVAGSSMSVLEMDAASNRGIDDIRTLRERVGLAPAEGEMVVYVIDEVHMLTTEAFNALLKTLEEPPAHVVFVMCTTEAGKVPDTIKSRCTRILFQKANPEEVVRSLNKAVAGEGIKIDSDSLMAIAERVDGSFRDGMKILEQLSQKGSKITKEDVDNLTGFSDDYEVSNLIRTMKELDANKGLVILREKESRGIDFGVLGKRLLEKLREELISEVTSGSKDVDNIKNLTVMAEMVSKAVGEMKYAVIPQLPLELVVVEWGMGGVSRSSTGQVIEPKADVENVELSKPTKTVKKAESQKKVTDTKTMTKSSTRVDESREKQAKVASEIISKPKDSSIGLSLDTVVKSWPAIMRAVKPHNHSLEALLRATEPDECDGGKLIIRVYYSFHKEQLEQERHRATLEEVFSTELKTPVILEFILGNRAKEAVVKSDKSTANVTGKLNDEELASAAEEIFG